MLNLLSKALTHLALLAAFEPRSLVLLSALGNVCIIFLHIQLARSLLTLRCRWQEGYGRNDENTYWFPASTAIQSLHLCRTSGGYLCFLYVFLDSRLAVWLNLGRWIRLFIKNPGSLSRLCPRQQGVFMLVEPVSKQWVMHSEMIFSWSVISLCAALLSVSFGIWGLPAMFSPKLLAAHFMVYWLWCSFK